MVLNLRIAGYYGMGTLLVILLMNLGWPWTAPLLWPAFSLTGVTCAYLGIGPKIFGKSEGRLPCVTRLLFAPTLLGQHLSLHHYRRQCRPWDEVFPSFIIGRILTAAEAQTLVKRGVTAVVDLTAEFTETASLRSLHYYNLKLLDLTAPPQEALSGAVDFIRKEILAGGTVYVHCKVGYSRTAVVAGAHLLACGHCRSLDDAVECLRVARPGIVIRPEAARALEEFESKQNSGPLCR